jgi:hypothetical protein
MNSTSLEKGHVGTALRPMPQTEPSSVFTGLAETLPFPELTDRIAEIGPDVSLGNGLVVEPTDMRTGAVVANDGRLC